MFGISGFEFLIIAVLILLLFGPDKMPEFGRTIGRVLKQFNDAKSEVEKVVRTEMYSSDSSKNLFTSPTSPFTPSQKTESAAAPEKAPVSRDFADDEEEEEEE